jgi:hypothetical protein
MSRRGMPARAMPAAHRSARHFVRHYVEMVIAMFAGMVVLGLPAEGALRMLGTSSDELETAAPAALLLGMAVIMTVPMVAWMRHRGHGWRPCHEMAASMFLPTFAMIALMGLGLVESVATLMTLEHVAMLPCMLVAMLLRIDEYACHHGRHAAVPAASAWTRDAEAGAR